MFGRRLPQALLDFADLAGRTDATRGLQAGHDARSPLCARSWPPVTRGSRLSMLSIPAPGTVEFADNGQAIGTVADDLDLGRPGGVGA